MALRLKISDLTNMVSESVNRILSETKSLINEHVDEIWNLDTAIRLIEQQWESPDDFWYVYISQRKKDNAQTFHKNYNSDASTRFQVNFIAWGVVSGNTKDEAIESLKHIKMNINRSYQTQISSKGKIIQTIPSVRDLSSVVYLCNKFNARCYMTVNKRSMKQTNQYSDYLKQRGTERGAEFQFAAGRQMENDDANVKWTQVRPYGLIDCDIDDERAQKELEDYLSKNGIQWVDKYNSHDGMHYIFKNRDAAKLKYDYFEKYRPQNIKGRRQNDPQVLFKGDACILLYSAQY